LAFVGPLGMYPKTREAAEPKMTTKIGSFYRNSLVAEFGESGSGILQLYYEKMA